MQNNHDRPEFDSIDVAASSSKKMELRDVNVVFENGRVTNISVTDPELLTYFRLLHHLERYEFALSCLRKSQKNVNKVLDIGIGDGFGVRALYDGLCSYQHSTPKVTGIELEPDVADLCRSKNPDFEVLQTNILNLQPEANYDVVLCFELLGNVSLSSDQDLLKKIEGCLAIGGIAFLSIATFDESAYGRERRKTYSARIYNRNSLIDSVKAVFRQHEISLYGQYYPLKRINEPGEPIWENEQGNEAADFSVVVIKRV